MFLCPVWMLRLLVLMFNMYCFGNGNHARNFKVSGAKSTLTNLDPTDFQVIIPRLKYIAEENRSKNKRNFHDFSKHKYGIADFKAELTFTAFQKNFTLDLFQNRGLFAAKYEEKLDGLKKNFNECYFYGILRGKKKSTISLSTCEGIEGLVNDGRMSYYLKPLTGDSTGLHLFYKTKGVILDDHGTFKHNIRHDKLINALGMQRYALHSFTNRNNLRLRRGISKDILSKTKYVELVIINDVVQFEAHGKNLTKTNQRAKLIANIVDSIFKPLNVRLALVAIETWDVNDQLKPDDDADIYLGKLIKYRKKNLLGKHANDVTMLLTGAKLKESVRGKAQVMSICTKQSAGIIYDASENAAFTANTFAHELGHVFGMYHDDDLPQCVCNASKSQGCVMSESIGSEPATDFSNCSVKEFQEGLSRGLGSCLMNVPETLFGGPVCGDGILGQGEECDCGTAQECKDKGDKCCDHETCKLHAHAQCGDGACCEDCKFKTLGTLCRETLNECDIPETCTGSSGMCPENNYVQNGYPCAKNSAYCYFGECLSHDEQCQELWGNDAVSGPDKCYQYHNTRGDKFGHCRKTRKGKYRTCDFQNAKCGKLWCLSKNRRPVLGIKRDVMNSYWRLDDQVITCKGTSLELGMKAPVATITLEGTKCGDGKVCLNRQCKSIDVLLKKMPVCPNNCSGHGLCTNVGKCFCFETWTGKSCEEKYTIVESTTRTIASITALLFSSSKTQISTETPPTPTKTKGITAASVQSGRKIVYIIAGSLSFVGLIVIIAMSVRRYRRYNRQQTFAIQKKSKKTTILSRAEIRSI